MTDHTSRNSIEITQNDITFSVLKPSVLSSASSSFANAADTAPVSIITTTCELTKEFYSPMFAKAA